MPLRCKPLIHEAASLPARKGSSEKYSKFLPQRGERFMQAPGPSKTSIPKVLHSSARASPSLSIRSRFQVEAAHEAVGKAVAGRLLPSEECGSGMRRTPCGPSVQISSGTPSRSMGVVDQKPAPMESAAFSSRVISLIICSMDGFIFFPLPFNEHKSHKLFGRVRAHSEPPR